MRERGQGGARVHINTTTATGGAKCFACVGFFSHCNRMCYGNQPSMSWIANWSPSLPQCRQHYHCTRFTWLLSAQLSPEEEAQTVGRVWSSHCPHSPNGKSDTRMALKLDGAFETCLTSFANKTLTPSNWLIAISCIGIWACVPK